MRLNARAFFDSFLIIFFTVVLVTSLGYNPKARLIPLVVATPCLGMAIYRFFVDLFAREEGLSGEDELLRRVMERVEVTADQKGEKEKMSAGEKRRRFFIIVLWILGFSASIFLFGFIITIPLFTFLFMRSHRESWALSVCCAAGLWGAVYLAFVVILKGQLYKGFLFKLLS